MKVSIVIPNYNGEKLLIKNLPRVIAVLEDYAENHNQTIELVVNDDGSKDSSKEILQKYEQEKKRGRVIFTIIYNEHNFGFSTTVNRGVTKATGDIVVLLNSDVIPDKGFLEPLLKHFLNDTVFAVGCMDKSVEGKDIVLRGRGIGKWQRGFLGHSRGELNKTNTLWVSGGSGAFRKSMWEKLGGLNEMMNPFYWEDIDLSYRALSAGYELVFEKESTVVHEHEEGAIKKSATPMRVKVTSYRNQLFFVWTNIDELSLLFSHLFWLPITLLSTLVKGDRAFVQAFGRALVKLPEVLKRRVRVQKLRKRSDSSILSSYSS